MLDLLGVQIVEIVVGIVAGIILIGGFGAYIAYRIWAKKHGKSACDGNCAHCSGCHILDKNEEKTTKNDFDDKNQ